MTTAASITVRVPLAIRRRPGRKTIVMPENAAGPAPARTRADPALVKALARAHRWQRMLDKGRYASISELAAGEKIDRGYLGRVLQLTLLAPDIVEAVLDGRPHPEVALPRLMEPLPGDWLEQRRGLMNTTETATAARFRGSFPNAPLLHSAERGVGDDA